MALALATPVMLQPTPTSATEGFESGACVFDLSVELIGTTLSIDTVGDGVCVTTEGMGEGALDVWLPGLLGFDCESGYVLGAGTDGNGAFTVAVDDDVVLSVSNMLVVGAGGGAALTVAFEGQSGARVVAGEGTFVLMDETDPPCPETSQVTTWRGTVVFADPTIP